MGRTVRLAPDAAGSRRRACESTEFLLGVEAGNGADGEHAGELVREIREQTGLQVDWRNVLHM
jgi:hypothetical protein